MPVLSQHLKGVLITALGVLIISPDGLLTRLIHTDHWTLIFWRAVLLAFGMWVITCMVHRSKVWWAYKTMGKHDFMLVACYCCSMVFFITAITHTSVANTLIILSTTPLFAALIALVVLREAIEIRTWFAIFFVAIGVYVISSAAGSENTSLYGDISAMCGAFFLAAGFVVVRCKPTISVFAVFSTAGLVTALLILPLAQPLSATPQDMGYLIVMGVIMLPAGTALMYIGPKYIPASEVGLMLLLESVLGPLWVWLALSEQPGTRTLFGGAIIISTLAINTLWAMRTAAINRAVGRQRV